MTDKSKAIIARRLRKRFEQYREVLEKHKDLSPHHRAAVEELEKKLFGLGDPAKPA